MQTEPAAGAAAADRMLHQSSCCQNQAQPALVLGSCPWAKKKQQSHSAVWCFNSPPRNTNRVALSRPAQHPFSKCSEQADAHAQGWLPNTPTGYPLLRVLLQPSLKLKGSWIGRAADLPACQHHPARLCRVSHTHFMWVTSSFKIRQLPMLLSHLHYLAVSFQSRKFPQLLKTRVKSQAS